MKPLCLQVGSNLLRVRCPWCGADDDRVVDSRIAEEGAAIRRRRECGICAQRYTTFERVEEQPLWVMKRSGVREPFDRVKVIAGMASACKNRPVSDESLAAVASRIEESLREISLEVTTEQVGLAVMAELKDLDEVTYLRFASVYKGFEDADDFRREVGLLVKTTEPKLH